jgi:hypothetical protein
LKTENLLKIYLIGKHRIFLAHDEETQTTHATAVHEEFQEEASTPSTTLIAEENREVVDRYMIDDLPHIEDIDAEDDNQDDEVLPVEECLDNKDKLSMETVQRLLRQRRRLSSLIKRLNKQQNMFCRPDQQMEHVEYRYGNKKNGYMQERGASSQSTQATG